MFDQLFTSRSRARALCSGPYGEMLNGFAQRLVCAGYAKITLRRHLRAAEHLVTWAAKQGLAHDCVSDALLPCFCAHLACCRCPGYGGRRHDLARGARLFLAYVSSGDLGPIKATASARQDSDLLRAFREWMHTQRGACDATLDNYDIPLRDLLGHAGDDVSRLDAPFLRQFILARARETGPAAIRHATTAVRMFVRFLVADGRCAADLVAAVPTLAHQRLSTLPRYLHEDEVARVLTACDQRTPVGRRDYAMVLLLARLGLRAGDLVRLRLQDIDWQGAWIAVSGKSTRETKLPLTQEVGQALVNYLLAGRPPSEDEALFVRARAPFQAFADHAAVSVVVARAMRRSGVTCPSRGAAHVLRHSVATALLRHGVTLQVISTLLRHQSIETTQIYAKVDVAALRRVAQPWPETPSC